MLYSLQAQFNLTISLVCMYQQLLRRRFAFLMSNSHANLTNIAHTEFRRVYLRFICKKWVKFIEKINNFGPFLTHRSTRFWEKIWKERIYTIMLWNSTSYPLLSQYPPPIHCHPNILPPIHCHPNILPPIHCYLIKDLLILLLPILFTVIPLKLIITP
jgi:hypothetical protein